MTNASKLINAAMALQFDGYLSFCPPERWVFQPTHLPLLVQIEQGIRSDDIIIFTSLLRDGSGPLMTSFMTTMLIEESHGTIVDGLSVVSGQLSVSYYLMKSTKTMSARTFLQLLFNFTEIVGWSSMDLIDNTTDPMPPAEDDWMPRQLFAT